MEPVSKDPDVFDVAVCAALSSLTKVSFEPTCTCTAGGLYLKSVILTRLVFFKETAGPLASDCSVDPALSEKRATPPVASTSDVPRAARRRLRNRDILLYIGPGARTDHYSRHGGELVLSQ